MSYQVLARKWRPQIFEEVVGQEPITKTLQNAIATGRVAHAFLFSGPRGVGKTSVARILAKALNCVHGPTPEPCNTCQVCQEITGGSAMDVLEIDGASNRGIDDRRTEGVRSGQRARPRQVRRWSRAQAVRPACWRHPAASAADDAPSPPLVHPRSQP